MKENPGNVKNFRDFFLYQYQFRKYNKRDKNNQGPKNRTPICFKTQRRIQYMPGMQYIRL